MVGVVSSIFVPSCIQYLAVLSEDRYRLLLFNLQGAKIRDVHESAKPDVEEEVMTPEHLLPMTPPAHWSLQRPMCRTLIDLGNEFIDTV